MFLKRLEASGDSSTQAGDYKNIRYLGFVVTPDATATYAGAVTRSNYPTLNITGTRPGGEVVNVATNMNLLDIMEIVAQEEGGMQWQLNAGEGVSGFAILSPDPRGVDYVNFQVSVVSWPAAAANAVRTLDVYLEVADPQPASDDYYVYSEVGNAPTSSNVGGPGIDVYVLASLFTSAANARGLQNLAELRIHAVQSNDQVLSDFTRTGAPYFGYLNLLPIPGNLPTNISFSAAGTYITRTLR